MNDTLQAGIEHELRFRIPQSKTVPALYPESDEFQVMPEVFATGFFIGLVEWTCIQAVNPHLDWPREQTVGTHVNVSHEAATPPGLEVVVHVELAEVDGRRLIFDVEASDGVDMIGQGSHERFVIDAETFSQQVAHKGEEESHRDSPRTTEQSHTHIENDTMMNLKETDIETDRLTFRARVTGPDPSADATDWLEGDDRLALCLHGFPDDAGTFDGLAGQLAEAGYRVVAPYMRGYGATGRPPLKAHNYSAPALSADVAVLLNALEATDPLVIGHDWGAVAVSTLSAFDPDAIGRAVVMAVPPNFVPGLDAHGAQAFRSWYMGLFQAPGLAEDAVRRDHYALVERLWSLWSPNWEYPAERLESVKRTLGQGKTVEAALLYYRSFFERALARPADDAHVQGIEVPTLVIGGREDGCIGIDIFDNVEEYYDGPVEVERIPDAGHFVQHEALDTVAARILDHAE